MEFTELYDAFNQKIIENTKHRRGRIDLKYK